jgi:vacuolar-type H+-ATPase subunit H
MCKECSTKYQEQYRARNADRLRAKSKDYYTEHKEKIIAKGQERYSEKKDDILAYCRQRYEDKREEISARTKQYYQNNKDAIKKKNGKYTIERYRNDHKFCVKMRLRHRLREAFKRYSRNGKTRISKDYGIDYDAIFRHIGPCPGAIKDYHIDHIRPLCIFDFDDPEQVKLAFAPENHQWLPKEENLAKHSKITIAIDGEVAQGEDR